MKDLKLSFKYSNETAVSTIISQVHLSVVLTPSGTESAKTCQIISHLQMTSSSILLFSTISSMMTSQLLQIVSVSPLLHFSWDSNGCHRFKGRLGRESYAASIQLEYLCTPSTCIGTDVVRQTMAFAFFLQQASLVQSSHDTVFSIKTILIFMGP